MSRSSKHEQPDQDEFCSAENPCGERFDLRGRFDELVVIVATMLGAAEIDCLDDKSNVWRSAMLDARAALKKWRSDG